MGNFLVCSEEKDPAVVEKSVTGVNNIICLFCFYYFDKNLASFQLCTLFRNKKTFKNLNNMIRNFLLTFRFIHQIGKINFRVDFFWLLLTLFPAVLVSLNRNKSFYKYKFVIIS